jgi:DNA-binding response OmpR family regulator
MDDDPGSAPALVRGLRDEGFDVELATSAADGTKRALDDGFAAVIVDLLPHASSLLVLERLHAKTSLPVVVLSAQSELAHRLECFGLGAADYISKPFWVEELAARLRARLRVSAPVPRRTTSWGNVVIDADARTVRLGDRDANLTRHEFDVLWHLCERPGRAVSRGQLAERVLAPFEERDARTVDSHIARIRRKLGPDGGKRIVTVWGIGYRFEPA